jgi:hypothetical protein
MMLSNDSRSSVQVDTAIGRCWKLAKRFLCFIFCIIAAIQVNMPHFTKENVKPNAIESELSSFHLPQVLALCSVCISLAMNDILLIQCSVNLCNDGSFVIVTVTYLLCKVHGRSNWSVNH